MQKKMIRSKKYRSVRRRYIGLVEKLINEICSAYGISKIITENILVAVTEAVNNAMQHGKQT